MILKYTSPEKARKLAPLLLIVVRDLRARGLHSDPCWMNETDHNSV